MRRTLRKTRHQRFRNYASRRFPAKFVINDGRNKQKTKELDHFYLNSNCKSIAIYNQMQFSFKRF